jgi:hypothetical protein
MQKSKRNYSETINLKLDWFKRQRKNLCDMGLNDEKLNDKIRAVQRLILDY